MRDVLKMLAVSGCIAGMLTLATIEILYLLNGSPIMVMPYCCDAEYYIEIPFLIIASILIFKWSLE